MCCWNWASRAVFGERIWADRNKTEIPAQFGRSRVPGVTYAVQIVGLAVLRTVRPLVTKHEDRTPMVGDRTRAALEREKMLALRTLKELEFDRSMKKISDDDYREMSTRLRARASRIIRQLDAGAGYRTKIEADLAKRLEKSEPESKVRAQGRTCAGCQTVNDTDAKFCKGCGSRLEAAIHA